MIIVLSPAKTLDFETPVTVAAATQPDFLEQSQRLIQQLRTLSPVEIGSLMSISDQLAVLNVQRFADWSLPFTLKNARQAVLAFNGDVYEGLDAASLSLADLQFAQERLRILSGLYGLLRPLDLMQPYRLEMGTRLAHACGKDLYAFWGERLTEALNSALLEQNAPAMLNLASEEYFRALKPKMLPVPVIQPIFEDWSNGKFKVVSFYAKRARGLMARFAITRRIQKPDGLQDFPEAGYGFAADVSDNRRWVFRRKMQ